MYISQMSIIVSTTGSMGADFLQHIFNRHQGLVRPFVEKNPQLAANWVAVSRQKRDQAISAAHLTDLFGRDSLKEMESDLLLSQEDIVHIADQILYKAVQMASPDGLRIDIRAANRLDKDLAATFASLR